jgi:hypothetical protein
VIDAIERDDLREALSLAMTGWLKARG